MAKKIFKGIFGGGKKKAADPAPVDDGQTHKPIITELAGTVPGVKKRRSVRPADTILGSARETLG